MSRHAEHAGKHALRRHGEVQLLGQPRLTTMHAVGQSLLIGPIASVGVVAPLVAAHAGAVAPLVVLLAFAGSLCVGWTVGLYARRYAGAGGIYEFVACTHGKLPGILAAGVYFFGSLTASGIIALLTGLLWQNFAQTQLGFDPGWWTGGVAALLLVVAVMYRGVGLSTRTQLTLTALSAVPCRGAGGELELTDLAPRQRRLAVGVVLLACEQTPEQAGELARGRDRSDLKAAACASKPTSKIGSKTDYAPAAAICSSQGAAAADLHLPSQHVTLGRAIIPGVTPSLHGETDTVPALDARYQGHPAAAASTWRCATTATWRLESFRAHSPFLWQDRYDNDAYRRSYFDLAARYESLALSAHEDGAFGARCEDVDGKFVSRDLLDSVAEIGLVASLAGPLANVEILDIGAGYGRLGHRFDELLGSTCRVRCVDGVPASSHICAHYLAHRAATQASMVALDEIEESLRRTPASIACNIHSFPEMPLSAIEWWLRLIAEHEVPLLFLVPNKIGDLRSSERDRTRLDFRPLLTRLGFSLVHEQLKYRISRSSDDANVVFQDAHMLFAR